MTEWRAETVFCDDIRVEANGKHILVGVYGVDLVPSALPAVFPIGLWIRFWGIPEGRHQFHLRLLNPSGEESAGFGGDTEVVRSDAPTIFAVSGLPVNVNEFGDIVVQFAFDDEEPIEVGRLKVSPPPATAQPFPVQSS